MTRRAGVFLVLLSALAGACDDRRPDAVLTVIDKIGVSNQLSACPGRCDTWENCNEVCDDAGKGDACSGVEPVSLTGHDEVAVYINAEDTGAFFLHHHHSDRISCGKSASSAINVTLPDGERPVTIRVTFDCTTIPEQPKNSCDPASLCTYAAARWQECP